MTGTGTQTDPYIVLNYDDFCNMTGGKGKYYRLGADIDFAQTDRKPDAGAIEVAMAGLDGDGHTVSNFFGRFIYPTERNVFLQNNNSNKIVVKNTNFKGIYLSGGWTSLTYDYSAVFSFENCRIAFKVNDTSSGDMAKHPFFYDSELKDSEILLEGTSDFARPITENSMNGCLMKLDLTFLNKNFTSTTTLFKGAISFSGITGSIFTDNSGGANYILSNANILNSYFALNFDKISSFSMSNKFSGVNFYDKEVMSNLVGKMPSASNFYALTTEQCKSAEYLQSIDFPCSAG